MCRQKIYKTLVVEQTGLNVEVPLAELLGDTLSHSLSGEALELLLEASLDGSGTIVNTAYIGGRTIQTNGRTFGDSSDRRSMARWEHALRQLLENDLVTERGHRGEIFEVAERGYQLAEQMRSEGENGS